MCNLTREERDFLEKGHIDVEEDNTNQEEDSDNKDEENAKQNDESEVLNYYQFYQICYIALQRHSKALIR